MCSPSKVVCFVCFKSFSKKNAKSEKCRECGDYKCPLCSGCLCDLTTEGQRVALAMMKTYEPLLGNEYDFSDHKEIEKRVKKSLKKR